MNQEDIDFLYWHAVSKMRLGAFDTAAAIFHVIEQYHDQAALGRAYCLVRQGYYEQSLSILQAPHHKEGRSRAIHERLLRRCQKELNHATV